MQYLIRSAKITDPGNPANGKTVDILISNGIIKDMKKGLRAPEVKIIEAPNLHVSPGWFDMQANFRDPGMEYKEDIASGCAAAAAGGYTGVCLMPSTDPPVQSKSGIEYVRKKAMGMPVDVHPAGALSVDMKGKDLSEMYDMLSSGAVAFTDDKRPVADAGLLVRALQYAGPIGALIMTYCQDRSISLDGKVNESPVSVRLGMKGIPALAEEVMVARNLFLAAYCNSRIHLQSVSTAGAVALIREAKRKKIKVTASVNAHHLFMDDSMLEDFDTSLKVDPPLRTKKDRDALRTAVADGTIDVIVSDHSPEDIENKVIEFDHAAFGMSCIETTFAMANMSRGRMSIDKLVEKLCHNPRKILGLPAMRIRKGEKANLTLFDPNRKWTFLPGSSRSKGKNNPMEGKQLLGKVLGIMNADKTVLELSR